MIVGAEMQFATKMTIASSCKPGSLFLSVLSAMRNKETVDEERYFEPDQRQIEEAARNAANAAKAGLIPVEPLLQSNRDTTQPCRGFVNRRKLPKGWDRTKPRRRGGRSPTRREAILRAQAP